MYKFSFNAVIFDLDGVITQTATLHSLAWKKMFDEYLCIRKKRKGEDYEEFTHEKDYLNYVDGKPRYEGVKSFLESRGIQIPYGDPSNLPNEETICGLGNRKNNLFNELISQGKVDVYTSTIDLINELKQKNIKLGVASSSKNCKAILIAAGLLDLFDTMVDGVISSERGLKGKPEPDIFLTACNNLGVQYDKAVVVEDAVSGVKAGENGHFGLVIGVARENNEIELKSNGADIVVNDLEEITIDTIEYWFAKELEAEKWTLGYFDYDEDDEKKREALLTIGNGYFGTRGVMEEFKANGINYPGTYIAGVYNKLRSHIAGKTVINEDFVNCPNWLHITFKIDNNEWFNLETFKIINISRKLDFKKAKLNKRMLVKDSQGRESLIESIRIVSMHNPHIACLRYKISPLNYSSIITIKSSLDGAIINAGIDRYKQLSSKHLKTIQQEGKGQISYLLTQTTQSKIQIAEASKLIVSENKESISPKISVSSEFEGRIDSYLKWEAKPGKTICIDKLVAIYTSKDSELDETTTPLQMALKIIKSELSFKEVVQKSVQQWGEIWKKIDIELKGDRFVQKLLRLNLFHLMITYSPHNEYIDAGIPARGLHGEAYRGHIFWDTLFILPFYFMHFPQIAKSALLYRYRRLDSAREYAKECGYEGAVFPWQSGLSGKEETQTLHLNPRSGEWGPDYSSLQRHVSLAVAYNIWYYFWFTNDNEFMENYGAEIFLEICKFWINKAEMNDQRTYKIRNIVGPDEFHEMLPNSTEEGLKDNSYTNIMVVWTLNRAFEILEILNRKNKEKIIKKLNLTNSELKKWRDVTKRLNIIISDEGVLAQFDGYFDLKELDWAHYRKKYGNIHRMDRILRAEGKNPDEYKVAKQADVLMTFYTLKPSKVREIVKSLGYNVQEDFLKINYDYYAKRTSHGSTMSKVVHSYLLSLLGRQEEAYEYYLDALKSDYIDIQGGTTGEGIHMGVMAGTVLLTLHLIAGLDLRSNEVCLNPNLVKALRSMKFNFNFRGDTYYFEVTHEKVRFFVTSMKKKEVTINIRGSNILVGTQTPDNSREWTEYTIASSAFKKLN